ncbi:thioredoxin domain protein [Fibrisoma limi BUZ 3]|uniref:Thioredoxin domain protein n=1 Tax=Fibrisoma limi BUZ 3 TaxID=1185876 RepID=I2GPI6_9BACT|nr:thioredoxin family protein [Fibrisoma limi]CCH55814.1 thioredoxin domain protein [Fibrisoma limi BUZ 3]
MIRFCLLLSACLTLLASSSFAQQVAFEKGSWNDMLARAKAENKLIFVDVYATWCGPCKMLDRFVFTDKKVAKTFNTFFLNYKVDAERGEGRTIAQNYRVQAYPTALFVDGNGQLIDSWVGSKSAYEFEQEGQRVFRKTPAGMTLSLCDAQFREGNRQSSFMSMYLRLRRSVGLETASLLNDYVKNLPIDSLSTPAITSLLLAHTTTCRGAAFETLFSRRQETRFRRAVDVILSNDVNAAGQQRDKKLLESVCQLVDQLETPENAAFSNATHYLTYYATAEDWKAYADQADAFTARHLLPTLTTDFKQQNLASFEKNYYLLCNIGFYYAQNIKDDTRLRNVLSWLGTSNEILSTSLNTSLQAWLRYRLGEREEAIQLQQKAIDIARAAGDDTSSYEATLQKMQKRRAI